MTPMQDFHWVSERAQCSLSVVFEMLRQQVNEDVKERQTLSKPVSDIYGTPGYDHGFVFTDGRKSFTVVLQGPQLQERVSFTLEPHCIKVTDSDGVAILEATPSLNAEGQCVMKIGRQEYPLWYIRKMALERLFFEIVRV